MIVEDKREGGGGHPIQNQIQFSSVKCRKLSEIQKSLAGEIRYILAKYMAMNGDMGKIMKGWRTLDTESKVQQYIATRSLGTLWAPTPNWWPFGPA